MWTPSICQLKTTRCLSSILWLLTILFALQGVSHALVITISPVTVDESNTKNPFLGSRDVLLQRMASVPSVPYIRGKVIDGGQMNSKVSIFWSGFEPPMDGFRTAKNWGKQVFGCNKAVLYNEALLPADWVYFQSADANDMPTPIQDTQKTQVMSAVFAQTSSGNAYVVLQDGTEFKPSSTWINYEYPNLTAPGSAVTEIFLVRWPSLTQESIWKRGNPQQGVWPPVGADQNIFAG